MRVPLVALAANCATVVMGAVTRSCDLETLWRHIKCHFYMQRHILRCVSMPFEILLSVKKKNYCFSSLWYINAIFIQVSCKSLSEPPTKIKPNASSQRYNDLLRYRCTIFGPPTPLINQILADVTGNTYGVNRSVITYRIHYRISEKSQHITLSNYILTF